MRGRVAPPPIERPSGPSPQWPTRYRRWVAAETVIQILLAVLAAVAYTGGTRPGAGVPFTIWATASSAQALLMPLILYTVAARSIRSFSLRTADLATWVRAIAPVTVGALLVSGRGGAVVTVAVLVGAELTDLVDGYLARRGTASTFGGSWDMEIDAIFTAFLAQYAATVSGYHPFVLVLGAMRYLFFLFARRMPKAERYPALYRWFAKTVAASIAAALIGAIALAAFGYRQTGTVILAVILALQIASFLWEFLLLRHAGEGRPR